MKKAKKSREAVKKPGKRAAKITQDATAGIPEGEGIKVSEPSKKRGRPILYSQNLASEFCCRIADGASERKVCESEDMPDRKTIQRWVESNEDFCRQYARAREERGWTLAEAALAVCDEAVPLVETQHGKYYDAGAVANKRLRVDTLKWFASKLAPKVFGEKVQVGGPGNGPIQITPQVIPPDYAKLQELAAKYVARKE